MSKDVFSIIDGGRASVSITERVVETLSVGPRFAEVIRLNQNAPMAALGWRFFQDSNHTAATPLWVAAGTRTQLPVDGRGMLQNSYGVNSSQWLDPVTARFRPDHEGDFFFYRLNLSVRSTVNNRGVLIDFDIGTTNHVFNVRQQISAGAGIAIPMSFDCPSGGSLKMLQNGGAFYITPEVDIYVTSISILAFKAFSVRE